MCDFEWMWVQFLNGNDNGVDFGGGLLVLINSMTFQVLFDYVLKGHLSLVYEYICNFVFPAAHCFPWSYNLNYFEITVNTLTANYEYSRSNRENLLLPIQIELSKKPKILCWDFLESTLNLQCLEKKWAS